MSKLPIMLALVAGLGINAAIAQNATPATTTRPNDSTIQSGRDTPTNHQVLKPGDRNCLRDTGSLIPAAKGKCQPVPGRTYTSRELRDTGQINNARALQMLDPDINIGH